MEYYAAADIGGTNIAIGIVDENAKIVAKSSIKTEAARGFDAVIADIAGVVRNLSAKAGVKPVRIGAGCPGSVASGVVYSARNLGWDNAPLEAALCSALGIPACAENDANTAALGEYLAGACKTGGKSVENAVIITLGTGIGGGIIQGGSILSGINGGAWEIWHMSIMADGRECNCGRRGCFEQYASATALVRITAEAIQREPAGEMAKVAESYGKVSARTAFIAANKGDTAAAAVVDTYIGYLACGVANVINILQPDVVCIGGGVCGEGDGLLLPLREKLSRIVFTRGLRVNTDVVLCSLGNEAGLIGAAFIKRADRGQLLP